jgi:hypothetical protein
LADHSLLTFSTPRRVVRVDTVDTVDNRGTKFFSTTQLTESLSSTVSTLSTVLCKPLLILAPLPRVLLLSFYL